MKIEAISLTINIGKNISIHQYVLSLFLVFHLTSIDQNADEVQIQTKSLNPGSVNNRILETETGTQGSYILENPGKNCFIFKALKVLEFGQN